MVKARGSVLKLSDQSQGTRIGELGFARLGLNELLGAGLGLMVYMQILIDHNYHTQLLGFKAKFMTIRIT